MPAAGQMTTEELERLVRQLAAHPDIRIVRRLVSAHGRVPPPGHVVAKGAVIDTETTGMRVEHDRIIELGLVTFEFDATTGEVFRVLETFNGMEDPGFPIPPESTEVHGITDQMVAGRCIDDTRVSALLDGVSLVIAHNAKFDRSFVEMRFPVFVQLPWACSLAQVDWQHEGLGSQKLDYLAYRMGFFYDAHRAEADCLALLQILQYQLPQSGKRALGAVLDRCHAREYTLWARGSRFEAKDLLKERAYRWDAGQKCWYKRVTEQALASELDWLKHAVYGGRRAAIDVDVDDAHSRFSLRKGTTESRLL